MTNKTLDKEQRRFEERFSHVTACLDDVCEECHNDRTCYMVGDLKDFLLQSNKRVMEETRKEIVDALEFEFRQSLQNGRETPAEFWGGNDPRIRVKWLLDVFIPRLRGKNKTKTQNEK